jgi:hypothetical protein
MLVVVGILLFYFLDELSQADSGIDVDDPLYFEVLSTLLNSTSTLNDVNPAAVEACKIFLDDSGSVKSEENYERCILDWRVHHDSWIEKQDESTYEIDPDEVTIVRAHG